MKLSFMALAVALTPVAAAAPDKCTPGQLEKVVTILSTSSKDHVRDCQAASGGFSIFPPAAKSPTDGQVKHMCASPACLELTSDVLDAGLVDCTLEWNGKSLNLHEMASSFQALCGQLNPGAGSESADWERVRMRRERDASSASSAVEVGIIETFRPERTHMEQYTSPPPCAEDTHTDARHEDSSHVTPAATDMSASEETSAKYHATPVPTYVNHETYRSESPRHNGYATSAPPYDQHGSSSKPQSEVYSTSEAVDSPYEPEKPQPGHSVTPKLGHNWYEREMDETSDYKQEQAAYELDGEDSDYAAPTDEYDDSDYELVGDTDHEPDQYAANMDVEDSDYATVAKR